MPYNPKKNGAAHYKSWMQLTQTQIDAIAAIEGVDNTANPNDEQFAQVVYVVNQSGGGSSTSAIADGVNDTLFATVADLTNSNPLATMLVDANGDQIVSFGAASEAEGTHDAAAAAKIMQIGGYAEDGVPVAVADGDAVRLWIDTFGRQIIAGFNSTLNAIDVNIVDDSLTNKLGPETNLDEVVVDTNGASIDVSNYHNVTIHITSASVTDGATFNIESSMDETNWAPIDSETIIINGTTEWAYSNIAWKYIRTTITSRTDGTFTSVVFAGN